MSCPYAVALSDDDETPSSGDPSHPKKGDFLSTLNSCPAFSSRGACPFSQATSPSEIQKTLLQVPPSHFQHEAPFGKALVHLHQVSVETKTDQFALLSEGCPVQTYYQKQQQDAQTQQERVDIRQAMEGYSLQAIMAQMARDLLGDDEVEEEGGDERMPETDKDNETALNASPSEYSSTVAPQEPQEISTETIDTTRRRSSLSQALKTGTADSHQAAEEVHFVKNFVQGKIDRTLYASMVLSLYHVYRALEEELDRLAPLHFRKLHFPKELHRTAALEEDIDFWHGSSTSSNMAISPATQDYIDRTRFIAQNHPLLLLSHAYTRYLGDLSGGKILQRVAKRALGLNDGEGLAFYSFPEISSAKKFKDKYRQALDDMELSQQDIEALVGEANVAFVMNMRLFEELDVQACIPGASVRNLQDALDMATAGNNNRNMTRMQSDNHEDGGDSQKAPCPFASIKGGATPMTKQVAEKRCPWPFVFFHDPIMGLQDYQTWVVVGLLLCYVWSFLSPTSLNA